MANDKKFVDFNGTKVIPGWPEYLEFCQTITSYTINGKKHARIPYGSESQRIKQQRPCRNCAAIHGQLHTAYCDWEECPVCEGQVESCGCHYDQEEIKKYYL